jgi:hypothetical protein
MPTSTGSTPPSLRNSQTGGSPLNLPAGRFRAQSAPAGTFQTKRPPAGFVAPACLGWRKRPDDRFFAGALTPPPGSCDTSSKELLMHTNKSAADFRKMLAARLLSSSLSSLTLSLSL